MVKHCSFQHGDEHEPPEGDLQGKARQGDPDAQFQLGLIYCRGEGVPTDHGEAAKWFRAAALQGHAGAQNNLGSMYLEGRGVRGDIVKASNRGTLWVNSTSGLGTNTVRAWKPTLRKP